MSARRRHLLLAVAALALAVVPAAALLALPDRDKAVARAERIHATPPAAASVSLAGATYGTPIPRSFFGVSTEYFSLPLYERNQSVFQRVLSMLHVQGDGPMILRIGGDSADRSFWSPTLARGADWEFALTRGWVSRTGAVVRRLGLRVILDLNLVTGSPLRAVRWARVAEAGLPRGSIVGFEIGNEPDLYTHWYWEAITARTRSYAQLLPSKLSAPMYTRDFLSYARMLGRTAPQVPLVGPAIANPTLDVSWIANLVEHARGALGAVSAHRYPLSACVPRWSLAYPTVARVLSERVSAGVAKSAVPGIHLAHAAGVPFRLTELNSVTCGGRRGVSDTFATALWAPDALFELLRAGADGANVHIRENTINGPFALSAGGLNARPLLYGLLLFTRTLGPSSRLVPLRVHAAPSLHLKAWGVSVLGHTLHVLLIDKGNRAANVELNLPATGPATVQRLIAPAATSRSGVTLAGQWLGRNGRWHGQRTAQRILRSRTGYHVTVAPFSAALVSVNLPGVHRARTKRAENVLRRSSRTRKHR